MLNQFTLPVKILATVINSNFGLLRFFCWRTNVNCIERPHHSIKHAGTNRR